MVEKDRKKIQENEEEEKVDYLPADQRSGKKGELFDGSATSELPHDINDMGQFGFNEPLNMYMLGFFHLRGKI